MTEDAVAQSPPGKEWQETRDKGGVRPHDQGSKRVRLYMKRLGAVGAERCRAPGASHDSGNRPKSGRIARMCWKGREDHGKEALSILGTSVDVRETERHTKSDI